MNVWNNWRIDKLYNCQCPIIQMLLLLSLLLNENCNHDMILISEFYCFFIIFFHRTALKGRSCQCTTKFVKTSSQCSITSSWSHSLTRHCGMKGDSLTHAPLQHHQLVRERERGGGEGEGEGEREREREREREGERRMEVEDEKDKCVSFSL